MGEGLHKVTGRPDHSELRCGHCSGPLFASNFRFEDGDFGDHCEDGRFGPETVTIIIECPACGHEVYRERSQKLE